MTRMVRAGCFGSFAIMAPAAIEMPMPAPSSIAPVPRSQESRWPPITTTSSGFELPRTSPITL